MDLRTNYLDLRLQNPLVVGASPFSGDMDALRRLEDAGAAAVVLHSLFEEEIHRNVRMHLLVESFGESFSEALSYLPELDGYHVGPYRYLDMIRKAKEAVSVPVIASLNGSTPGGWTRYARLMEEAGADAVELNFYYLSANIEESGADIERFLIQTISDVRSSISVPLAVKLSPFYSAFANLAMQIAYTGANGIVLFNRFYQPDLDVDRLRIVPNIRLSTSDELRLRVRWAAILHGRLPLSIAITGGVHTSEDVVKAVMAGADVTQVVSALLKHGTPHIADLLAGIRTWMEEHEYESLLQMKGCMSALRSPNPAAYERANYIRTIDSWPDADFRDRRTLHHPSGGDF